ncbi:MAG TPA: DUF72 domain-containing protein [Burkholderiales bacterium]|jgi:uncharacterized protein YecE (DUF72 family)
MQPEDTRAAWRARREERRAKQRGQNIIRAQKMHVARLAHDQNQARPPARIPTRQSRDDANAQQAFVGCSGWFYWHWGDTFYPEGLPTNRWFEHYASRFNTVELNAPFYSWPTLATVNTWKRQTGRRRFTYAIKVSELITHTKRFVRTATLVRDFGLIADLLGPHFGCFLFQLPPSLHYTNAALRRIVKQLDPRHRNVVEFRHSSWWNETVYKAFREANAIFCSTSGPRLPDELVKTADDVYIRFHGTTNWYRHDYTKEELAVWTDRIHRSGAKRVWAYFNNDREGYAIKNARELLRELRRKRNVNAP